jgi:uncharacterized protein (TIGR02594 family)
VSEFGPGGIHAGSTPLEVALTQLGVRETAPNRGPQVDEYLRGVGLEPTAGSYPWCVAFVRWCCSRTGIWLPRTAGVKRLWEMGKESGLRVSEPEPGDIAIHLRPDGLGHCGFFMQMAEDDDWIETIDGNTNAEGSREGDRVAIKQRPAAYWNMGFLRPRLGKIGVA